MLLGFALFLAGPKIMNEDLIESYQDEFTLKPYGNETVDIPLSFDQAFYMLSARNLVLKNVVLVEINGSSPFTLYKLDDNTTVKLAEHTLFYSSNLSDAGTMTRLIVKNEVSGNINVKTNLKRVLTIKIADFTIPHAGFMISIATLLTLQFLSIVNNGDTLIRSILNRIVFKLGRKNTNKQKSHLSASVVLEIFIPIILLCVSVHVLMVYGQRLSLVKNIASYFTDYIARFIFLGVVVFYFLAVITGILDLMFRSVKVWILKSKGQAFLKIYEESLQAEKAEAKIVLPFAFIILVISTVMVVYKFESKIILGIAICLGLILYAMVCYADIKRWQTRLWIGGSKETFADFIEINAKTTGFGVLGTVAIFAMFTMMMPLFSALTRSLLLLEFYPSFIYQAEQSFVLWVNDVFILFGQYQVLLCLIVIGSYWITRVMICEFEAKYRSRLLTDMVMFFTVFAVSEYLKWTYCFFIQNQPYNIATIPISILIGMIASMLKDLLTEIQPKTS
jgi:hypothetical protein